VSGQHFAKISKPIPTKRALQLTVGAGLVVGRLLGGQGEVGGLRHLPVQAPIFRGNWKKMESNCRDDASPFLANGCGEMDATDIEADS
jgi:hypothetical protein